MKRLGSVLLALSLLFAGGAVTAPAASAHPYVNGCYKAHTVFPYKHVPYTQRVFSSAGTYGPWVETRWTVTNKLTGSVHYHNTAKRCRNFPYGF